MSRKDMYQEVTNIIIEALQEGVRPWIKPWGDSSPALSMPLRHNGETYNGINVLILWSVAMKMEYSSPYWMTYKQAKQLGGQVRKGEKAAPVFYAGSLKVEDDDPQANTDENGEKFIRYMKSYAVFNVEQIDDLPEKYNPAPFIAPQIEENMQRSAAAETFIKHTGADMRSGFDRAYFHTVEDYIGLPDFEEFKTTHGYYSTAFHELGHWTGHKSRLDRIKKTNDRRSTEYAFEELIAEISAAFLCVDHGINTDFEGQHVSYIQTWLQLLKDDKKAIFRAASAAQKAANYLHELQPTQPDNDPDGTEAEDETEDTASTGAEIEAAAATPAPQQVACQDTPPAEPEQEIFEIDWHSEWQKIRVQVKCTRNKFCDFDHLEIQSIAPERHPLPITETGYKSHFLPHGEIDSFGGAVETALMWLNTEAQATGWIEQQQAARQGSLF